MSAYCSFAELAADQQRGRDYWIRSRRRASRVLVIAPHGGRLEAGSDQIAAAIAGRDFSLYIFLATRSHGNPRLHLASTCFDEPRCLRLAAVHDTLLTIHGCAGEGERVFLGGLDEELKAELAAAYRAAGLDPCLDGHPWPGRHPRNICNRGRRGVGVQLELTWDLRVGGRRRAELIAATRAVLGRHDGRLTPRPSPRRPGLPNWLRRRRDGLP